MATLTATDISLDVSARVGSRATRGDADITRRELIFMFIVLQGALGIATNLTPAIIVRVTSGHVALGLPALLGIGASLMLLTIGSGVLRDKKWGIAGTIICMIFMSLGAVAGWLLPHHEPVGLMELVTGLVLPLFVVVLLFKRQHQAVP
jgi:uncharacterized membrane protein